MLHSGREGWSEVGVRRLDGAQFRPSVKTKIQNPKSKILVEFVVCPTLRMRYLSD